MLLRLGNRLLFLLGFGLVALLGLQYRCCLLLIVVGARDLLRSGFLRVGLAVFAAHLAMLAFVFECPRLRAFLLTKIIQRAAGVRIHAVQDDMDMPVLGVVVADKYCLVLVPLHVFQECIGGFDHVLGCWRIVLVPRQRHCFHRLFAHATAALHAGLHLQVRLIFSDAPHFVERAKRIVVHAISRFGKPDAFRCLRFQFFVERRIVGFVVQVILARATERAAGRLNADDHGASFRHRVSRVSASARNSSDGGTWCVLQCLAIWLSSTPCLRSSW